MVSSVFFNLALGLILHALVFINIIFQISWCMLRFKHVRRCFFYLEVVFLEGTESHIDNVHCLMYCIFLLASSVFSKVLTLVHLCFLCTLIEIMSRVFYNKTQL